MKLSDYISKGRERVNEVGRKVGNAVYDGAGDFLADTEVSLANVGKVGGAVTLGLAAAGCGTLTNTLNISEKPKHVDPVNYDIEEINIEGRDFAGLPLEEGYTAKRGGNLMNRGILEKSILVPMDKQKHTIRRGSFGERDNAKVKPKDEIYFLMKCERIAPGKVEILEKEGQDEKETLIIGDPRNYKTEERNGETSFETGAPKGLDEVVIGGENYLLFDSPDLEVEPLEKGDYLPAIFLERAGKPYAELDTEDGDITDLINGYALIPVRASKVKVPEDSDSDTRSKAITK